MFHEDMGELHEQSLEVVMDLMTVAPLLNDSVCAGLHRALPDDLDIESWGKIYDSVIEMVNRGALTLYVTEPISRCRCEKCCISYSLDKIYEMMKTGDMVLDDCGTSVHILEESIKACDECPRLEDTEI